MKTNFLDTDTPPKSISWTRILQKTHSGTQTLPKNDASSSYSTILGIQKGNRLIISIRMQWNRSRGTKIALKNRFGSISPHSYPLKGGLHIVYILYIRVKGYPLRDIWSLGALGYGSGLGGFFRRRRRRRRRRRSRRRRRPGWVDMYMYMYMYSTCKYASEK